MRYKTIMKRLEKIHHELSNGQMKKAAKSLFELIQEINYYAGKEEEKEVDGKVLQHLFGWYLKLWDEKPPEFFRYPAKWKDVVGKELKALIKLYEFLEKEIEHLKTDYEEFKKSSSRDKSLNFFRSFYLPSINTKIRELRDKKWTSEKFERGIDYYLREDLPI